jgi:proline iminopeptidase
LALAYATEFPERVSELILRGIFLLRDQEIRWFYQEGASRIFPDAFEAYRNHIPRSEQNDLVQAYAKRLTSADEATRIAAAKAWTRWEFSTSQLVPTDAAKEMADNDQFSLAFARIENHYFVNKGFFKEGDAILDRVQRIEDIPGVIVHGRYDVVCPVENAWDLHRLWPKSQLIITAQAGHSALENETCSELVRATDRFV